MIRTTFFAIFLLLTAIAPALAQSTPPPDHAAEIRAAMARLPISAGIWQGEAWFRKGPGEPQKIQQWERVESRLDGLVLLIEGVGRDESGKIVHNAFAMLTFDPEAKSYRMTAWLADGRTTQAETSFDESGFTWGFKVPNGPRTRYRITSPADGVWQENGEVSMDGGTTWHPFFGMKLHRTEAEKK